MPLLPLLLLLGTVGSRGCRQYSMVMVLQPLPVVPVPGSGTSLLMQWLPWGQYRLARGLGPSWLGGRCQQQQQQQ